MSCCADRSMTQKSELTLASYDFKQGMINCRLVKKQAQVSHKNLKYRPT